MRIFEVFVYAAGVCCRNFAGGGCALRRNGRCLQTSSMIGDALSHTSLAGVAAGLLLGVNPVAGAAAACVAASFGIEAIRRKLPRYSEMSISIIMSAGIGLAGVLSGFVKIRQTSIAFCSEALWRSVMPR